MAPSIKVALRVAHKDANKSIRRMFRSVGFPVYDGQPQHSRDILVVVKHYAAAKRKQRNPKQRVLWLDINGGQPKSPSTHKTLPQTPPVPLITANKYYQHKPGCYVCYLPFVDLKEFTKRKRRPYHPPMCLVHNVRRWGYGWALKHLQPHIQFFGKGVGCMRLLDPKQVARYLSRAVCYVHIKPKDCPGYSLYQALLAQCPPVITSVFLERTQYTDLYEHGETCLVAQDDNALTLTDRASHLVASITKQIERLKDLELNDYIGQQGKQRIKELMWNPERQTDLESFQQFLEENVL